MTYTPHTPSDRREMLEAIGVPTLEALLEPIPRELRLERPLDLPPALSELETASLLKEIASQSHHCDGLVSFLGGGIYDHYIPAAVDQILQRSEFYTAYTPYQAEASQGTLQAIYEYQTLLCQLTGMDVANASLYDGASGLAEAALMALGLKKGRRRLVISRGVHPHHRQVLRTYTRGIGAEIVEVPLRDGLVDRERLAAAAPGAAAVLVQTPNFLGCVEELAAIGEEARRAGALLIVSQDPISLAILEPPGHFGADIAVGEGQALGNPPSFGGPLLGYFACRGEYVRQMPGRLVGATVDARGQRGFVITLQTREQHIRREKATSNICTNQALNALAATVYLALLGRGGVREVATLCLQKAHYAAREIARMPGFALLTPAPFFKEFAVRLPAPPREVLGACEAHGILAGIDLAPFDLGWEGALLVAVTERRTKEEIDRLVGCLRPFGRA